MSGWEKHKREWMRFETNCRWYLYPTRPETVFEAGLYFEQIDYSYDEYSKVMLVYQVFLEYVIFLTMY